MWHYDYVGEKTIIFWKCYLKKEAMLDGTLCGIMNILKKKKDFEVVGFFPNTLEGECICAERGLVWGLIV